MSLRTSEEILAIADGVLARAGEAQAEVSVSERRSALTRFALNAIHQNVADASLRLRLRLIRDGRVGVAQLRSDAPDAADRLVESAERARRLAPAGEVSPLPVAQEGAGDGRTAFSEATAEAAPDLRADGVRLVTAAAETAGLEAFGAFSTTAAQLAIVNTAGVRRHALSTSADMVAVLRGDSGAGYADRTSADVSTLDIAGLAAEVVETCRRNQEPTPVEPGDHEVVLGPYAVAELLEHLSWVGFSALAGQEGRSFMRPGERLMSEAVSIDDDAADGERRPFPFDQEGVASRRVDIIERGVCRDLVHDTSTARRQGVASTGHALPMPNTWGPMARHLALAPGDSTVDELISSVRRGLYVTRLWYVRSVHPLRTLITGMTREGTFRIEDGRLGRAVRDLRFTQSIVDALADVRGISRVRSPHRAETENVVLVPHLHLGSFTFTS